MRGLVTAGRSFRLERFRWSSRSFRAKSILVLGGLGRLFAELGYHAARALDHPPRSVLPKFVTSVISKRVGGKTYYYLATSARVDGKPRIVSQKYLGTAADIEAAMDGAVCMPSRTRHLAFGDLAATWAVIEKLEVVGIIDRVSGGRRADAGASVGASTGQHPADRAALPRPTR